MTDQPAPIDDGEQGIMVTCALCGDTFNNWEDGFFFPAGDCERIPSEYTDVPICDNCGVEIAVRYRWWG